MNTYNIIIDFAEVRNWNEKLGIASLEDAWGKDCDLKRTYKTDMLTRKDVAKAVEEMLCLSDSVDYRHLHDGDGSHDYFLYGTFENGKGEELEAEASEGFYVEYYISVEKIAPVHASDISDDKLYS